MSVEDDMIKALQQQLREAHNEITRLEGTVTRLQGRIEILQGKYNELKRLCHYWEKDAARRDEELLMRRASQED